MRTLSPSSQILKITQGLICIFILLYFNTATAQANYQTERNNIHQLEKVLTEKIHLHIDRSIFSPGEDIWFKAYLLEGTSHVLSSSSDNLHVELISPTGSIIDSRTILLLDGAGYGDIHIDKEKYSEGTYQLRAYTNFMRNFGEDIFFTKNIIIKENIEEKDFAKETNDPEINLDFFPEGGNLIEGVLNKIAFKATNSMGRGVNIRFKLFDQYNNLMQQTAAIHNGMGFINLMPKPNTKYYVTIDSIGFEQHNIFLPDATTGYSIVVGNQFKNLLDFQINTTPENVKRQEIKYTIQSRGVLFVSNKVIIDNQAKSVRIEKEKLPEGISSITLYDENDIPVCERLVFNQFYKKVKIKVLTDKPEYEPREKIQLTIETTDENGAPVPTNLSLAVIDNYINQSEKKLGVANAGVVSSILLNADLKGDIEEPMYYFQDFDMKKHYLLDLVLLTHGWRKYVWKEIVNKELLSLEYDYEKGFSFSGMITKSMSKKILPECKITLAMLEEDIFFHESKSDSNGRFRFDNIYLMDTTMVVFQAYNQRERRNTGIVLDNNMYIPPKTDGFNGQIGFYDNSELDKFAAQTESIIKMQNALEAKRHILIGEITVNAKKKENDGHHRIYKEANHVIVVDEVMETYPDVFSMIRGRLPGVQVMGACPDVQVIMRGFSSIVGDNSAGCLLNGMFVDIETLCLVMPFDIDKIEVLQGANASIFGSRAANGILAVYTKKGPDRRIVDPVGIEKRKQRGYYRAREFYVPNYDKPSEEFTTADIRNTLFWEPFITSNAEGKAQVSFFNGDKTTNYNIIIEGVGLAGGMGESKMEYSVVPKEY